MNRPNSVKTVVKNADLLDGFVAEADLKREL